jgi:hypothetical protein
VEAVGIEPLAIHLVQTILERFRGQVVGKNTSKEHEEDAFPDILMTMSQIPDANRELAEVGEMFAVFNALRRRGGR